MGTVITANADCTEITGCIENKSSNSITDDSATDEEKNSKNEENLAWIQTLLTEQECKDLLNVTGDLGEDPSSKFFVQRNKNIAFCAKLEGHWFHIHKNYFNQASMYNDFSGGYKRYYREMRTDWMDCAIVQKILNGYQTAFNIPDNRLILVQIQSSHISCKPIQIRKSDSVITINHKNNEFDINPDFDIEHQLSIQKSLESISVHTPTHAHGHKAIESIEITELCSPQESHGVDLDIAFDIDANDISPIVPTMSITGQGIHTDGKDSAILVCLERSNITGAQNSAYYDLEGTYVLLDPFVLNAGNAMFWCDNKIYHYVNNAKLIDENKPGSRTVLIAHYPAIFDIGGTNNPNNTLRTNMFSTRKQLRNAPL